MLRYFFNQIVVDHRPYHLTSLFNRLGANGSRSGGEGLVCYCKAEPISQIHWNQSVFPSPVNSKQGPKQRRRIARRWLAGASSAKAALQRNDTRRDWSESLERSAFPGKFLREYPRKGLSLCSVYKGEKMETHITFCNKAFNDSTHPTL